MPKVVVTGSCGLIGSEVSRFFARQSFEVFGIDDNHRAVFFGPDGDTSWVLERLRREIPGYRHSALDIRDRERVLELLDEVRPELIIHAAAQPSHDRAADIPFLDFEVNALGTLHLLEAARRSCPESPFIHMSTNKVYGDRPNGIALRELDTRFDYADPAFEHGIPEAKLYSLQLLGLHVVSHCSCGCPTVDFSVEGSEVTTVGPSHILADFLGKTPDGIDVGVILHGREGKISELEVYPLGQTSALLPKIETLH